MKACLAPISGLGLAACMLVGATFAEDLPDVVARVYPSAVQIQLQATPRTKPLPAEMEEFFSRFRPQGASGPQSRSGPSSVGAGFVVGADGYLVTADFAVEGGSDIDVIFPDRRKFRAVVVGRDRGSGVAVLKIDAAGLVPLRFGDSDKLRLGERVFAIGAPYNMPGTVTDGIVSALGREHPGIGPALYIQSSVYINPGSAGGPLMNMKGEVVGMNTHIYSRSGSFVGLSFSVPAELVQKAYEEIRRTGKVTRARIGISVADIPASPTGPADGALVHDVTPGGPAASAGIRDNDIIVRFGNTPVTTGTHLTRLVQWGRPGDSVAIELLRDGRRQTVSVVLEEQK